MTGKRFKLKTLRDGRAMLNIACGIKMDWGWNNLDFSPYARFARHPRLARVMNKIRFLSDERFDRLQRVDPEIVLWDLRKGIPFDDETFDVVYHSHFLEHIERESVNTFLRECHRVLKRGGTIRVVVPDLQYYVRRYVASVTHMEGGDMREIDEHNKIIYDLFDQMVRATPAGTAKQVPLVRLIERLLRGNAAQVGELHRWMYDRYSLTALLFSVGFSHTQVQGATSSRIVGWREFKLDINDDGSDYKRESLYVEASK